jgi:hypothetical protein
MSKSVLITFGCSWTAGIGVGYTHGMLSPEYKSIAQDNSINDEYSFRGLLAKKYNIENINFSRGGSSNQLQFRLLKNFVCSDHFKYLVDNHTVIMLHGITSTARNELYINDKESLINFKYDDLAYHEWADIFVKHFYNHDNEVNRLQEDMLLFNQFYAATNVNNLWFDTFNHHNYTNSIDNLIEQNSIGRDMLTSMALLNGFTEQDDSYHLSSWVVDSSRVRFLVEKGYLNPISKHPTKKGHEMIADIIDKELEKIIK